MPGSTLAMDGIITTGPGVKDSGIAEGGISASNELFNAAIIAVPKSRVEDRITMYPAVSPAASGIMSRSGFKNFDFGATVSDVCADVVPSVRTNLTSTAASPADGFTRTIPVATACVSEI